MTTDHDVHEPELMDVDCDELEASFDADLTAASALLLAPLPAEILNDLNDSFMESEKREENLVNVESHSPPPSSPAVPVPDAAAQRLFDTHVFTPPAPYHEPARDSTSERPDYADHNDDDADSSAGLSEDERGSIEAAPQADSASGSAVPLPSVKSELSGFLREIHNHIFEEHKIHPPPVWTGRNFRTFQLNDKQSVPTCEDLLEAHSIDAAVIPEMTVQDVSNLVAGLFGPRRRQLCHVFEKEQIDGAGLLLLTLKGYLDMLKIPVGPAITLDGICKRARELRNIPHPTD